MKIILSPAMNMKPESCVTLPNSLPVFLNESQQITALLKSYSPWELAAIMSLNEKLAVDSFDRNQHIRPDIKGSPALEVYNGLVFTYLHPQSFRLAEKTFASRHLFILSGLYGILRPYDSIYEYRLEMKNKIHINEQKSLYHFWGQKLYDQLQKQDGPIINLASDEYSKCIRKYLKPGDEFITCTFKVRHQGRYKIQATAAKMARGRMAGFIIRNQISSVHRLKEFSDDGYRFEESLATEKEYVFLKG